MQFISVVFAIYALGDRALVASQAWQRERGKFEVEADGKSSKSVVRTEETVQPGEAEAGVVWYERFVIRALVSEIQLTMM